MSEPSKPNTALATGGMSPKGITTVVKINRPNIDSADKKILCAAICKCRDAPSVGVDGRSLKQACVSGKLKELDAVLAHRSTYKPEVNFDMTKRPPAPIMDSGVETKGHDWLPGWIKKWWDTPDEAGNQRPLFRAGRGFIRRPDVIIVNDPRKPPTQDNIKQVVEIKFPPDQWSEAQREAYEKIAGSPEKLEKLEPSDCDCDKPEPERPQIPVEQLGAAAAAARILFMILAKRPLPPARTLAF